MDLALVQCHNCLKVFQYYDYLSHTEICKNYENYNTLSDIEADDENEGHGEDYFEYNKGARGAEALDLFNPMFNRGFYNNINNNMDIDINNNINLPENSVENLLTNIENIDIGLGCENIEQYGCKIIISEVIECAICLNNYDIGSEFYLMKCLHSFCKICAELWFESRSFCPLCKTNLKL